MPWVPHIWVNKWMFMFPYEFLSTKNFLQLLSSVMALCGPFTYHEMRTNNTNLNFHDSKHLLIPKVVMLHRFMLLQIEKSIYVVLYTEEILRWKIVWLYKTSRPHLTSTSVSAMNGYHDWYIYFLCVFVGVLSHIC